MVEVTPWRAKPALQRFIVDLWAILRQTVSTFLDNGGPLLSGALAFYALLAIAPLGLVAVYSAGLLFGEQAANQQLQLSLSHYVGTNAAATLSNLVEQLREQKGGRRASLLGVLLIFLGASRLFSQLQEAINQLWNVRTEFHNVRTSVLLTLYKKALALGLVLCFGALLTLLMVLTACGATAKEVLGSRLPGSTLMWSIGPMGTTAILVALTFGLVYRLMPDATVDWRDAFSGGLVSGVLFALAQWPLSFYLSRQGAESAYYGAAGSLVVLLLWIYYAAHIFFLGAQLTKVLAERGGRHPRPDSNAVLVKQVALDPIQPS